MRFVLSLQIMNQALEFFQQTGMRQLTDHRLELLSEREFQAGNHLQVQVSRYLWAEGEPQAVAAMVYHVVSESTAKEPVIELKYCIPGRRYCAFAGCKGSLCTSPHREEDCLHSHSTAEMISIAFSSAFFHAQGLGECWAGTDMPAATKKTLIWKPMPITPRMTSLLQQMLHHPYQGTEERLYVQSKALELLVISREQARHQAVRKTSARFLLHPEDREKIYQARDIMLQHLDEPITIRELSRKVAINECYLKKGFKEIFGTTIYDYFQRERMEKARQLLYEQGLSVSEVAARMGYSCISHFSTAFKKYTGLKPCELIR
ncbi:AraC-like DNA-binding protein [Thermoflavifilum aggregans]|uniref:AraC-like DNA-binding protein n=1 Tax=Thermoflavifilum aggregans TaxID=454188 RepID=A0A2M9CSS5_9BACT|nr:AraC family transcriptional regulator [Thermoflavifilum aggregans]PJJ74986.1 AraC-like DNA-binding protein [Thermoflavifilum aggregans]